MTMMRTNLILQLKMMMKKKNKLILRMCNPQMTLPWFSLPIHRRRRCAWFYPHRPVSLVLPCTRMPSDCPNNFHNHIHHIYNLHHPLIKIFYLASNTWCFFMKWQWRWLWIIDTSYFFTFLFICIMYMFYSNRSLFVQSQCHFVSVFVTFFCFVLDLTSRRRTRRRSSVGNGDRRRLSIAFIVLAFACFLRGGRYQRNRRWRGQCSNWCGDARFQCYCSSSNSDRA